MALKAGRTGADKTKGLRRAALGGVVCRASNAIAPRMNPTAALRRRRFADPRAPGES